MSTPFVAKSKSQSHLSFAILHPVTDSLSDALREKLLNHLKSEKIGMGRFEDIHAMNKGAYRGFADPSRRQIPSLDKAHELCRALGLDLRIVEANEEAPRLDDYAQIGIDAAIAAAGSGIINDDEGSTRQLSFRRTWLAEKGINPSRASVISVKGDSMAPTIADGSIVLIDQQRRTIKSNHIFAFVDDGELRIKRIFSSDPTKGLILYSDNSAILPEPRIGAEMNSMRIVGQVMWTAQDISDGVAVP